MSKAPARCISRGDRARRPRASRRRHSRRRLAERRRWRGSSRLFISLVALQVRVSSPRGYIRCPSLRSCAFSRRGFGLYFGPGNSGRIKPSPRACVFVMHDIRDAEKGDLVSAFQANVTRTNRNVISCIIVCDFEMSGVLSKFHSNVNDIFLQYKKFCSNDKNTSLLVESSKMSRCGSLGTNTTHLILRRIYMSETKFISP